ncbi:MAG TPA: peptide deformylase [Burkholderiales bacterium]|nr:peptide deformylase [Burkholderiales bacterium]
MAILKILLYPDRRLHTLAKPVVEVNDQVRKLVADMAETIYAAPGVGLAATQVDVHKQVIVIDISETRDKLLTFINPEILASSGVSDCEEGCLSVPGIFEKLQRAERVTVRALDREGKLFTLDADGLLSVCIQHEIDHLKGKVFVEYLSRLKQARILNKLKKMQRKIM